MRPITAAALAVALAGCTTVSPAQLPVDRDTLPNCTRACEQVGMKLSAIVFVSNYGGCVCQPAAAPGVSTPVAGASGAAAGGLVAILAEQAAAQQQQSQQAGAGAGHH